MADNNIQDVTNFLNKAAGVPPSEVEDEEKAATNSQVDEDEPLDSGAPDEEAPDEEEETTEEADEAEEEEGADQTFELSDDDLVEVQVDGEVVEVSLRDLKSAYSGEGAISKRLQDATERRKEAAAVATKIVNDGEMTRTAFINVIQQLDHMLHKPSIAMPGPDLRARNPAAYLDQLDRYNQETAKLEESRRALSNAFQQHATKIKEAKEVARQAEIHLLTDKFEPIRNEKSRPAAAQDILDAVAHYGFSSEDMDGIVDHRLYMMAHDAMQYHKLLKKGKPQLGDVRAKKDADPRTIRTIASRKVAAVNKAKQTQKIVSQARKSGSVDDIAALLTHKQSAKRR